MTVGLVEAPRLGLFDEDGRNWTCIFNRNPLYSKQVLAAGLQAAGFHTDIVDLTGCDDCQPFGEVFWGGRTLTKTMIGKPITALEPESRSVWGITANTVQEEEIQLLAVRHLSSSGRPVVVGGSQAMANPQPYLDAGAAAVILDKSGASNILVLDHVLGIANATPLEGVILKGSSRLPRRGKRLHPEEWPLPSVELAVQCLGTEYTNSPWVPGLGPIGSCHCDIGCDQSCSFCQTPTYGGYMRMSPKKVIQWLEIQKLAGARSIMMQPDQFLGRVLFANGREEVLDIMEGFHSHPTGIGKKWLEA